MQKSNIYKDSFVWIELATDIGGRVANFILSLEDGIVLEDISDNIYKLFGYKKYDIIKNRTLLSSIIDSKDLKRVIVQILKNSNGSFSFKVTTQSRTYKFVEVYFVKHDSRVFGYIIDTTQKVKFKDKIEYLTNYDLLTGLENRERIKKIIDSELKEINENQKSAILYLDLNRFKNINDSLGYQIGDKLLQHVSHRLRSCIKEDDTLARVGDDEFVILLSKINKKTLKSHIEIIAKRVYGILKRAFLIDKNLLHISASIGVAILGDDGNSSNELLKNADLAMNLAKRDQDHYLRYYKNSMISKSTSTLEIENDLNLALQNGEFELYYQPQVDIKSGVVTGAEALIRWQHPTKGMVSPFKFIPVAEETGLIVNIGNWVLKEACKRIKELQDDPNIPETFKKISVNISSKQFKLSTFTSDIQEIINEYKIDPSSLELEVTEGALISNIDSAIEKMMILKELGIKFSIDDFGTGYSSLTYLKRLPVDIIKIDKSFISNMHTDSSDRVLTQTIIQMSQNLRLGLIAEGVEKIEHLNFLEEKGCQSYQGYYFSKPLPFDEFKRLLLKRALATDIA